MPKAKVSAVEKGSFEEPPAAIISPDDFMRHYIDLSKLKRQMDELNGKYRAGRKALEAAGANLKALAMVEKVGKLEGDEQEALMRQFYRYAGWLKLPIGTQPSLFPDQPAEAVGMKMSAEQIEFAAEQAGYAAGKSGGDRDDNPEGPGTPTHVTWDNGWIRGQEAIAQRMGPGKEKRAGSRQRRGGTVARPHVLQAGREHLGTA